MKWYRTDIEDLSKRFRRNLINSITGFKAAVLVGTRNEAGQINLAIFNSAIHVGANPPLMGILVRPHTVPRHTLENIRQTGAFTLNHVREDMIDAAHATGSPVPREWSEFDLAGLQEAFTDHPAPYVAASPVQIGLLLREEHTIQTNGTILVVGEIVELKVPDEALEEDGYVDLARAGTVAIGGLDGYYRTERIKRIIRQ